MGSELEKLFKDITDDTVEMLRIHNCNKYYK